ncbi:Holliday junction branch migration protein RuvA [Patescibacteria group bacterium]|nr:Holliday junction branch migration protein RuvA [Patescibacteria group bacterium]
MISHLVGKIIHKDSGSVVLEAGGVGYNVAVTGETLAELTKKSSGSVSLWTHLSVREDSQDLYGFLTREEMEFFELLISISGIGPKTALSVLNASSIENLRTAVSSGEISYLTKISGIGRKLAEKIIFELKEKIGAAPEGGGASLAMKDDADVLEALISLGYGEREAREAIKKLPKDLTGTSERVKAVLKLLGK